MSSADWWAKKLQQQQPPAPPQRTESIPQAPSQIPMTQMPSFTQDNPAAKAQSAALTDTCPSCGSANYFSIQNTTPRCYDCGYPIEQSGSRYGSLTGANVIGDPKTARGNDPTSNYNPTQIIGRID